MVCFRLRPEVAGGEEKANEMTKKLLEAANASGRSYMTHAVVGGVYLIRFAVGGSLTEERHVNLAWQAVQEYADAILGTGADINVFC